MRSVHFGIVINEFFHEQIGGFGGYGALAKNVCEYFNAKKNSPAHFQIFLPKFWCEVTKTYNTKIVRHPNYHSKFKYYYERLVYEFEKKWPDYFLTVEFDMNYHLHLDNNKKPIIIWIQDPRTINDWNRIGTVDLEKKFLNITEGIEVLNKRISAFQDLVRLVEKQGRSISFVTQAPGLVAKAKDIYSIDSVDDVTFVPNPIEMNEVEPEFEQKAEVPQILYLGRMDPIKRPWIFFELARSLPQYNFVVAGVTHFSELIHPFIEKCKDLKNLEFRGLVIGQEKDALLRESWILVNTSIHEGLPVSWLEALFYKLPIVSTVNTENFASTYGEYVGEFLGDGADAVPNLIDAITGLVNDEKRRKNLAMSGYQHVIDTYSHRSFIQRLLHHVDSLNLS